MRGTLYTNLYSTYFPTGFLRNVNTFLEVMLTYCR